MAATDETARYERVAHDVSTYGAVALALAMATETNMVDSLCAAQSPMTSGQIACERKLKERYVREVLNSLTAVGLVQLEAGTGGEEGREARYWVPPPCRQMLQSYGANAMSVSASGMRYSDIRKCLALEGPAKVRNDAETFNAFEKGGLMVLDSIVQGLLQTPGLQDSLEKGIEALEVGGGTGWLFLRLASMFPNSRFTLSDPIQAPLDQARQQADTRGLQNLSVKVLDIFHTPDDIQESSFDWIATMDVIHDLPYPLRGLKEIARLLKPGGHFSLVDQFVPDHIRDNVDSKDVACLYALSTFLCLPESYQEADSEALGACWGTEKAQGLVRAAGMVVQGLTRSESLGTLAVCMCRKPEEGGGEGQVQV